MSGPIDPTAPTDPAMPSSGTAASDALTRHLNGVAEDMRVLAVLADRACLLVAADRLIARRRLRLTVMASAMAATLLAILAATALGLAGAGILVTGLLAGFGAGAPGLLLLVHPALLDRAIAIIRRYRR